LVPQGATSKTFAITTKVVSAITPVTITAAIGSTTTKTTLTVTPTLSSLSILPTSVVGNSNATATVTLTGPAPTGGAAIVFKSNLPAIATVASPSTVTAGAKTFGFTLTTATVTKNVLVTITASYGGVTKTATITVEPYPSSFGTSNLTNPQGIAIDAISQNIWVVSKNALTEFDQGGKYIGTFGKQYFRNAVGVGVDPVSEDVFVTDSYYDNINVFNKAGQLLHTITDFYLGSPLGVAGDGQGDVFVADTKYGYIFEYGVVTGNEENYWPLSGIPNGASVVTPTPAGLAIDQTGNIWTAVDNYIPLDAGDGSTLPPAIPEFSNAGSPLGGLTGNPGGTFGTGVLFEPFGVGVDPSGNIWAVDPLVNSVQEFTSAGDYVTKIGQTGSGPNAFSKPNGIVFNKAGVAYVLDNGNDRVVVFTPPFH
jgi:hypothetical protein